MDTQGLMVSLALMVCRDNLVSMEEEEIMDPMVKMEYQVKMVMREKLDSRDYQERLVSLEAWAFLVYQA